MKYTCKICNNYSADKLKHQFGQHLAQKHNASVLDYFIEHENFKIPVCKCGKPNKHKSGLVFRSTCGDKKCMSENFSRVHTIAQNREIVKQKTREARLRWMKENPEQTAWRLKAPSHPELKFEDGLKRFSLDKKYVIVKEFSVFPYYIDFAFLNEKVAVEIDGSQHENILVKEKDKKKDALLNANGWRVFRIVAAQLYSHPDLVIHEVEKFVGTSITNGVCGVKTAKEMKAELAKIEKKSKLKRIQMEFDRLEKLDFSKRGWKKEAAEMLNVLPTSVVRYIKRVHFLLYEKCIK